MPFYQNINPQSAEGKRTIRNLLLLRKALKARIPEKQEGSLLIATWNIREFDTPKYGGRTAEAFYYIAEIISRFDIIAIQEVKEDLSALKTLTAILGSHWKYLFTDVTAGRQGNGERLAFLLDTQKVRFGGLAGEMVLPPFQTKDRSTGQVVYEPVKQLARTPYLCGFKAGWTTFILTTVHILYGSAAANDPDRLGEIKEIAQAIAKKATDKYEWSNNLVLLGDFNIYSPEDQTYQAIKAAGFVIPDALKSLPGSNVPKNKFYDQIAFKVKPRRFDPTGKAGIFDYYQYVFTLNDEHSYADQMGSAYSITSKGRKKTAAEKTRYYKTYWRTYQMSDHLPMWVEIKTDHADAYLTAKLHSGKDSTDETRHG
ncbi:endonuclease/exonuclease/phosphatase family protein [Compostibacter hankyongensis]|uniref:Endonuclease/exonuclease/phosphatase domain-containing protein n=1 Tax=Compostibacter hankyongensis TaxID=1007089 RepID=A0ABP8FWG6_9BACT